MNEQVSDYKARTNGRFVGVLRWPDFELLWQAMASGEQDWYVYEPEEGGPPTKPFSATEMKAFLKTTEAYLRDKCAKDSCGAVYADSLTKPDFVKIYNPRLMGGCGMGRAPLPQWLLSRVKPVSLIE